VAFHVLCLAAAKQSPVLSQAIELVISAVGASGGIKICRYVLSGQLTEAFKRNSVPLSEEDVIYFLVGAFALIWLSIDTITRRLWAAYRAARSSSPVPLPVPPPPTL